MRALFGSISAITWAAFQCDRDDIYEPQDADADETEEQVGGGVNSPDVGNMKNIILSYSCPLEERTEVNIFDLLPGYIAKKLI